MKRYIVLGVNENPKYLYFIPLVVWAWKQFGWEMVIFYCPKDAGDRILTPLESLVFSFHRSWMIDVKGYKTETIAQLSRLYAGIMLESDGLDLRDSMLMTSDSDMLPLSDYWKPQDYKITCYGRDLSNEHFPICYICMDSKDWEQVMEPEFYEAEQDMKKDLDKYAPNAKNMWTLDQTIITERLNKWSGKILINRGTDKRTGYPLGRVDRSNWRLDHPQLIDAHLPHDILTNDESFRKVMQLLHLVWPKEDFKWFLEYHRDFKKLL